MDIHLDSYGSVLVAIGDAAEPLTFSQQFCGSSGNQWPLEWIGPRSWRLSR